MKKLTFLFVALLCLNYYSFSQTDPIFQISAEQGFLDLAGGKSITNIGNVVIEQTSWGGQAFLFNGSNYLEVADNDNLLDFVDNFTIEMVVRTTQSQHGVILSKGGLHTYPKNLILGIAPFENGNWFNWGVQGITSSGPVYQLGEYEKVVFICKSDSIYYVSGNMNGDWRHQPVMTDLFTAELSDEPFRIGAGFSTAPDPIQARYFDGEVVEVKVYDQALDPSEITPFEEPTNTEIIQGVLADDYNALVALYDSTGGPNWINNDGWLDSNVPVAEWYGVNVINSRVEGLSLPQNGLNGSIPVEFYNLTGIRYITLYENNLLGDIHSEIGKLTNLEGLDIGNCPLNGSFPTTIGNCTKLTYLSLDGCDFGGVLPIELCETALNECQFTGNNFDERSCPTIQCLVSTRDINFFGDQDQSQNSNFSLIRGCGICAESCNPSDSLALVALYRATNGDSWTNNTNWLSNNPVCSWYGVGELKNGHVSHINLGSNGLSGHLPDSISELTALEYFYVADNNIGGELPSGLFVNSGLKAIALWGNPITGNLPTEIGNCPELFSVDIGGTTIGGQIPTEIGNCLSLTSFSTENCDFSGILPMELCQTPLNYCSFSGNNFDSQSCPTIQCLIGSREIEFVGDQDQTQDNGFSLIRGCEQTDPLTTDSLALVALYDSTGGPSWTNNTGWLEPGVPVSEWNGVSVENGRVSGLNLENNNLKGRLPSEFYNLRRLRNFTIRENNIYGELKAEIGNLTELQSFFAEGNNFEGIIPTEIGNCNLSFFFINDNGFEGKIPDEICNNPLIEMTLAGNNFTAESCPAMLCLNEKQITFHDDIWITQKDGFSLLEGCGIIPSTEPVLEQDSLALVALYDSTAGDFWNNNDYWKSDYPVALWYGVNVSGGRVTGLNLCNNNLNGALPQELYDLTELRGLYLCVNNISGTLSSQITSMKYLTELNISATQLEGELPGELGTLQELWLLDIGNCNFEGTLPIELCNINIQEASFDLNYFDDSSCPTMDCLEINGVHFDNDPYQTQKTGIALAIECGRDMNAVPESDSLALVALYEATNGDNWYNRDNWLEGPIETWHGVWINEGRVAGLNLCSNNLNGTIPDAFYNLSGMDYFSFCDNQSLTGGLSDRISDMSQLNFIDLNSTQVGGVIPNTIGDVQYLNQMHIEGCNFTYIPDTICNTPITQINLQGNQLTSSSCEAVQCLVDQGVNFHGDVWQRQQDGFSIFEGCGIIPETEPVLEQDSLALVALYDSTGGEFWDNNEYWKSEYPVALWQGVRVKGGRVRDLYQLFENNMNGTLPLEFFNLTELEHIVLWNNPDLTGDLTAIGNITSLHNIHIWNTGLSGVIPSDIGKFTSLSELVINHNNFSGTIPQSLCETPVYELNFEGNNFTAESCPVIECLLAKEGTYLIGDPYQTQQSGIALAIDCGRDMNSVSELEMVALEALFYATEGQNWYNNYGWLDPDVPVSEWYGVQVVEGRVASLRLSNNNLIGFLPPEIGNLTYAWGLILKNNQISDTIPSEMGNLENLVMFNFANNSLEGEIPTELFNLVKLTGFSLAFNNLSGNLPPEIGNLVNVGWMILGDNQFSGSLPPEIGNMSKLRTVTLGNNQFSGIIPAEITNLTELSGLWMDNNQLTGPIPTGFSNIDGPLRLGFSENQLSGVLPADLCESNITNVNLSQNNFDSQSCPIIICMAENGVQFTGDPLQTQQNDFSLTIGCGYNPNPCSVSDSLALVAFYNATNGDKWDNNDNWLEGPVFTWNGVSVEDGRVTGLFLPENNLDGEMPLEFFTLTGLTSIELSWNDKLSVDLSLGIGQLTELQSLGINGQSIQGELPIEIANCSKLSGISITHSGLNFISDVLCDLPLNSVNFSQNFLDESSCATFICLASNGVYFEGDDAQKQQNGHSMLIDCGIPIIPCAYEDSIALVNFYYALEGNNWYNHTNWLEGPVSTWYGVNVTSGRVTQLALNGNNLVGSLPPDLYNLNELFVVGLTDNPALVGEISPSVENLQRLHHFNLSHTGVGGMLTEAIGNCGNLNEFQLAYTNIEGVLPENLCKAPLWSIDFTGSYFTAESCPVMECLAGKGVEFLGDPYQTQQTGIALAVECGKDMNAISESDLSALIALYDSTNGPDWTNNDGWLDPEVPVSEWYGVHVSEGRVIAIELWNNNLNGFIPDEFYNLTALVEFLFHDNPNLGGELSPLIGNLTELQGIHCNSTNFTGTLPFEIENCTNLNSIHIEGNQFSGALPQAFCNLPLEVANFGYNNFDIISSCSVMRCLKDKGVDFHSDFWQRQRDGFSLFEECDIIPNAPQVLEQDSLALVALYNNTNGPGWSNNDYWLTEYPVAVWNGVSVEGNRVVSINLSTWNEKFGMIGQLPEELGNLTALQYLNLAFNEISGPIPNSIGNLQNLEHFDMMENPLSGELPSSFWDLKNLRYLDFSSSQLTGNIPPEIGQLTNLETLYLYGNHFIGAIPEEIGNLYNLKILWIYEENMTGEIPNEIGNLTNLNSLLLVCNLTGIIPLEIGNLVNLQYLNLQQNNLTGSIPTEIGNLIKLEDLRLPFNQLTGSIPVEIGQLINLRILWLGVNDLSGTIPSELTNLKELSYFVINDNDFSGVLPIGLCETSLTRVGFSMNNFDNQSCPTMQCLVENGVTFAVDPSQTQKSGYSLFSECICQPTVVTNDISVYLDENGTASISVSDIDNGSSDQCGIDTLYLSKTEFSCADIGENTVDLILTNVYGQIEVNQAIVTVIDTIQPLVSLQNIEILNDPGECGAAIDISQSISVTDNCENYTISNDAPVFFPVGTTQVNWSITDAGGNIVTKVQNVAVLNTDPEILEINAPADPVDIINEINVSAFVDDNNLASTLWHWGDNSTSVGEIYDGVIQGSHYYNEPGVYVLTLTATDECGERDTLEHEYIVIYDPEGGFVTGGGWINSPAGASVEFPYATGKAKFGFVSKYKKGANVPTGNTEFKFRAGNLSYKSSEYEWLVIAGSKAKFKGRGTINGTGSYGFMISAIDGDLKNQPNPDKFRIKIWESISEETVYDNQMGADTNEDPTTVIGGGSIVIHNPKRKSAEVVTATEDALGLGFGKIIVYPNPVNKKLKVQGMDIHTHTAVKLIDITGQTLYSGQANSDILEIDMSQFAAGSYSLIIFTKQKVSNFKIIKK